MSLPRVSSPAALCQHTSAYVRIRACLTSVAQVSGACLCLVFRLLAHVCRSTSSVARLLHVSTSSYSHAAPHGGSGTRVCRMPHAVHVSPACRMGVHRVGKLEVLARLSQPLPLPCPCLIQSNYLHASFKPTTCMRTPASTCALSVPSTTCMCALNYLHAHACVHVFPQCV